MTITGLHNITLTIKLTTRCGSRLMCESHGQTCDECLRTEVTKKLGDDGALPHFSVDRIYLHSKPVIPLPKPEPDISVFFTTPRPGETYGPYFKVGWRGNLISREQAEKLVGSEALSKKIEQASQSAAGRTHP